MPREMERFTIESFLSNPTGKGTSYIANRSMIRTQMEMEYQAIKSDMKSTVYKDKNKYIIHVKFPSSANKNGEDKLYYDVLFEFTPIHKLIANDNNIKNYDIKFFSNMPSLGYTYFYVLYKNDFIIDKLIDKYPDEFIKERPEVRNPIQIFGFERGTYITALYIMDNDLYSKSTLDRLVSKDDIKSVYKDIKTFDKINAERKKLNIKKKEEKSRVKKIISKPFNRDGSEDRKNNTSKKSQKTKTTKSVNKITSKKAKTVNRIKKK